MGFYIYGKIVSIFIIVRYYPMQEQFQGVTSQTAVDKVEVFLRTIAQNLIMIVFGLLPLFFIPVLFCTFWVYKNFISYYWSTRLLYLFSVFQYYVQGQLRFLLRGHWLLSGVLLS